jgi:hypothetical protein
MPENTPQCKKGCFFKNLAAQLRSAWLACYINLKVHLKFLFQNQFYYIRLARQSLTELLTCRKTTNSHYFGVFTPSLHPSDHLPVHNSLHHKMQILFS